MSTEQFRLQSSGTALLVMDFQNATIGQGDGAKHARSQNVVTNVSSLIAGARSASIPVVHVHLVLDPSAHQMNAPIFHLMKEMGFSRGDQGSLPAKGLEPKEGDFVVQKMRMNPFLGTSLEPLLRGLGVQTIILTGAYTNVVVEHTARHAADLGFDVVVARDGTSSINDEWHRASIDFTLSLVAKVATCGEIIDALQPAPDARNERQSKITVQ